MIVHLVTLVLAVGVLAAAQTPIDGLFDKFFAAESPADAAAIGEQIAAAAEFEAAYARLKKDKKAWREELKERSAWEATLSDGLEDA